MGHNRRSSRTIHLGAFAVGSDSPVSIQTMLKCKTGDIEKAVVQARCVRSAGCDILRVAVRDDEDAAAIGALRDEFGDTMPIVADIHFDYRLALKALAHGALGLRINPSNIGKPEGVARIVEAAKNAHAAIRIGVNGGSLEKREREKGDTIKAEMLVSSALRQAEMLEALDFYNYKISVKASDTALCVEANRLLAKETNAPIHLGLTEAGTLITGAVHSAVALSRLLEEGIGDTIRISLAAEPVDEILAGRALWDALGLGRGGVRIIACPGCGRYRGEGAHACAARLERRLAHVRLSFRVAVMGCEVNGPGEASEADFAMVWRSSDVLLYEKGRMFAPMPPEEAEERIVQSVLLLEASKKETRSDMKRDDESFDKG